MSFILVLRSGYSASDHFKFSWTACAMVWFFGCVLVVFFYYVFTCSAGKCGGRGGTKFL